VSKDNIVGTQFHPEKSQKNGIKFIYNFLSWTP
ncbi:MAG: imidazole glycerol phosphate synthase subunit HisH, partial [Rickettsiales bacterium]|nr:imidazole glycerol phosphate synthase subunit HisH [Rickettsiales bacterium]